MQIYLKYFEIYFDILPPADHLKGPVHLVVNGEKDQEIAEKLTLLNLKTVVIIFHQILNARVDKKIKW